MNALTCRFFAFVSLCLISTHPVYACRDIAKPMPLLVQMNELGGNFEEDEIDRQLLSDLREIEALKRGLPSCVSWKVIHQYNRREQLRRVQEEHDLHELWKRANENNRGE